MAETLEGPLGWEYPLLNSLLDAMHTEVENTEYIVERDSDGNLVSLTPVEDPEEAREIVLSGAGEDEHEEPDT